MTDRPERLLNGIDDDKLLAAASLNGFETVVLLFDLERAASRRAAVAHELATEDEVRAVCRHGRAIKQVPYLLVGRHPETAARMIGSLPPLNVRIPERRTPQLGMVRALVF